MPDRERKRVPDDRSDILKGSLPNSPNYVSLLIHIIIIILVTPYQQQSLVISRRSQIITVYPIVRKLRLNIVD